MAKLYNFFVTDIRGRFFRYIFILFLALPVLSVSVAFNEASKEGGHACTNTRAQCLLANLLTAVHTLHCWAHIILIVILIWPIRI